MSLSNNLSELDSLLQDLSSAQFMAEVDRRNAGRVITLLHLIPVFFIFNISVSGKTYWTCVRCAWSIIQLLLFFSKYELAKVFYYVKIAL
jgi:hypothetical protein